MPFPAAPREPIPSWHNLIPSPKGPQTHPWLQNPTASQFPLLPLNPQSFQRSAPPKVFWRPQTTTGPRCPAPPGTVPLSTPMAQSPGTGTRAPSCPMGMGLEGSPLGVRCGNRAVSSFAGAGRGAERRKVTAAAPRSCLGKGGEKSCWRDAPGGNHFLPSLGNFHFQPQLPLPRLPPSRAALQAAATEGRNYPRRAENLPVYFRSLNYPAGGKLGRAGPCPAASTQSPKCFSGTWQTAGLPQRRCSPAFQCLTRPG